MSAETSTSDETQTERPALTLTTQQAVASDAAVTVGDTTPTELHAQLADQDGYRTAVVDAVLDLARGRTSAEFDALLDDVGVPINIADANLRMLCRRVARGDRAAVWQLFDAIQSLGQGRSTFDDVLAVPRLLAAADPSPTVAVHVEREFLERRSDQRERICEYWSALARGCDVRLVGTGLTLRKLARSHHADLPGDVRDQCSTHGRGQSESATVEAALDALDADGPYVQTLRHIADADSETRTYDALEDELALPRSTVRRHVGRLQELDLVSERFDHYGDSAVELLSAGRQYLDRLDSEIGRQRRLDDLPENSVHDSPNVSDNAVSPTRRHGEEGRAAPGGQVRHRLSQLHERRSLSRWETAAATGTAVEGALSLVNTPIEKLSDRGAPGWGYDEQRDVAVFSAEWDNPMQFAVCIALASTDYLTWQQILDEERLEGTDVAGLFEEQKGFLRTTRCFGYLPESCDDVTEFTDSLLEAGQELADMTKRLAHEEYDDRDQFRGAITREALGLYCVMVHLLDLYDVDVVIEARLPDYSRDYDADRQADLVENIARLVTLGSKYGHHVAHRQLYESRPDKRRQCLTPTVDAADPLGELIPSIVLAGNFRGKDAALADALRDRLADPDDLQDDAPEFAIPVDVVTDHGRRAYADAARRALEHKNLRLTREAVSLLHGLTATPYDAVEALAQLGKEPYGREVRVSEIRYALARLSPDRLLPDATPTVQAVISALLAADTPLSKRELAERADVSANSLCPNSGNWDALLATGLLEETSSGWRLDLAFNTPDERHTDRLPTLVTDDRVLARDVVQDAVFDVLEDPPTDVFDVWIDLVDGVPDVTRLEQWYEWAVWVVPLLRRLGGQDVGTAPGEQPTRDTVAFGADLEQSPIGPAPLAKPEVTP